MKLILSTVLALSAVTSVAQGQLMSKLTFEGPAGPAISLGSAESSFNTGYNFVFGAGWKFTAAFSSLLEFQYDHSSLTYRTLQSFCQPDGFNRFWSVTVNPHDYIHRKGKISHTTDGYGIYARSLAFTDPSQAVRYGDFNYRYCEGSGAPVVAEFTNYNGGHNVGSGVTYALGDSGLKVIADFRCNRFLSHANNEFATLSLGILS
jgi:hypothetical protein